MAAPGLEKYPRAFEPLKIGPLLVRNRIYMPPHGHPFWVGVPGLADKMPAAEAAFYYRERAAGGVALIFFSTMMIPMIGGHGSPTSESSVESYARLADVVHEEGAKIIAEVMYGGSAVGRWEPVGPTAPALGASLSQQYNGPTVRRPLNVDEIKLIIERYATTTRRLREAGWDGVEVHASHGVLMEHFISTYFNRRDDAYGGDLAGRCRFLVEALEAVQSELGPEMAVGMRICADELIAGGIDAAATREILEYLAPMDLLHFVDLDCSLEPEQAHLLSTTFFEPKHHNLPHVEAVSSAAKGSMVVIATPGRVTSLAEAEEVLAGGAVDMVGIGRGHIAEPQLVINALHGNESRSRACIAGNHCFDERAKGGLGCAINPGTAREERWGVRTMVPAPSRRRVVVIGGGPGGCEAARVAAQRGHEVTVYERRPALGGALSLWAKLPGCEHLEGVAAWYARELDLLGVTVRLGVEADPHLALESQPDVVIAATGSCFSRGGESGFKQSPIPGSMQDFVYAPEDVLEHGVELSGTVVVLDDEGRHAAAGMAVVAARAGREVEYVTRYPYATPALLFNANGRYLIDRMRTAGVKISTGCYISEIGDRQVTIYDTSSGAERTVEVGSVMLATMRRPETGVADQLAGTVPYVYVIGDAASPRTLIEATYEGQRFARVIGEPTMPTSVTADLFAGDAAALRAASLA